MLDNISNLLACFVRVNESIGAMTNASVGVKTDRVLLVHVCICFHTDRFPQKISNVDLESYCEIKTE